MEAQKNKDTGDKEERLLCRITYSMYSTFSPMPSAMALNVETGEFFPQDRLRSHSTDYEMAEALSYAWACDCRGRSRQRFDEQFVLRDGAGRPLKNAFYRVHVDANIVDVIDDTGGGIRGNHIDHFSGPGSAATRAWRASGGDLQNARVKFLGT
ncbi:hypothetical protein LJ655_10995 [Paraburkholderia sp. MMS20-SJTN17]|uniref:3D domain-containing protein n=1 Tax=Paraburkholderia translucens TaxID=2886945 RepID=A0ABS8KD55_9BURK|nr:hypothetical protein [Paraburkholderia sp. MMS20-SJTN17]MCC8402413.1 hypothetical protein [Paraburkholderia sp. MMS20-SJTN17]